MTKKPIAKEDLIKAIERLEKNPNDRLGMVTGLGVTATGAVGAGAVAAAIGATSTSIPLLTAVTGMTLVAAAPVALVAGAAAAGGAALFGASKLIRDSGMLDGKRKQIKREFEEKLNAVKAKEKKESVSDSAKANFYICLKKPIELDLIDPEEASLLMQNVESGHMELSEAVSLVKEIVSAHASQEDRAAKT